MSVLKKFVHALVIALTRVLSRLMPDKIPLTFVGTGSSAQLCESIAQMGIDKVLIVTDAMLVEIGLVDTVTKAAQAAGLSWSIYDGVEPDPTFTQVDAGLAQLSKESCGAVLAVGGGSSMDAAKAIVARATNHKSIEQLEGWFKVKQTPLPLFAIPTTAGTGSEVTIVAVVSDPQSHAKKFLVDPKLLPVMAALDPDLMVGLPPHITAATGMDALTHAVESYLSRTATRQTEEYSVAAVRMIFANLPTVYSNGGDVAARKAMALASYYAGVAFTRANVGYVHAIAHTFGAYYGTPHGLANAIVLPHVLEFSKVAAHKRLARLAEAIGLEGSGDADKADKFIAAVRELKSEVGIAETLESAKRDDVAAIAAQALTEAYLTYPVPRYMEQQQCEALLDQMVA